MQIVAILHCPDCMAERSYIALEHPPDVNLAYCAVCRHQWGYSQVPDVRMPDPHHHDPEVRAGGLQMRHGQPLYVVRPNLSPEVAAEGKAKRAEQRMGTLGIRRTSVSAQKAKASLADAMLEPDPMRRAQMLANLTAGGPTTAGRSDGSGRSVGGAEVARHRRSQR